MLDAALDALMLLLAVQLAGWRIRPLRVAAGALAGAGLAQLTRLCSLTRAQTALCWLPTALVMMGAAGGKRALERPLRSAALLLCAAGLLGGIVQALYGATGSLPAAYGAGGACTALITASVLRQRRCAQDVPTLRLSCRFAGRTAAFDAIADSGNTLRDYLTHLPVIVLPEGRGRACFDLRDKPLRPIFADTAGGRQMMGCFRPEDIRLTVHGEERAVRALVALSPALGDDAPALVPASLLGTPEPDKGKKR